MTAVPPNRPRLTTPRTAAPGPRSLTQAGRQPSGTCAECDSTRVTALAMTLTDGTRVSFVSCHDCEHRAWVHNGVALTFSDVLSRAAKQ